MDRTAPDLDPGTSVAVYVAGVGAPTSRCLSSLDTTRRYLEVTANEATRCRAGLSESPRAPAPPHDELRGLIRQPLSPMVSPAPCRCPTGLVPVARPEHYFTVQWKQVPSPGG